MKLMFIEELQILLGNLKKLSTQPTNDRPRGK
jgi:hypothetical protein